MIHPKVNFARTRKQSRCIVSKSGPQHSRVYYNGTHIRRSRTPASPGRTPFRIVARVRPKRSLSVRRRNQNGVSLISGFSGRTALRSD
jgi:hypothetical protein